MKYTIPQALILREADERLRDLERRAKLGDKEAAEQLKREQWRSASPGTVDFEKIKEIMIKTAGRHANQQAWISGGKNWGDVGHVGQARDSRDNLIKKINVNLKAIGSRAVLHKMKSGKPARLKNHLAVFLPSIGQWADANTGEILPKPPLETFATSPDLAAAYEALQAQIRNIALGSGVPNTVGYWADLYHDMMEWMDENKDSMTLDLFNQWAKAYLERLQGGGE